MNSIQSLTSADATFFGTRRRNTTAAASASIRPLQDRSTIPPSFYNVTASPHVFIAQCAAEKLNIDSSSLFSHGTQLPPTFQRAEFQYLGPTIGVHKIPQVAVLGRSNVGKSSLLNALMRKPLARASKQPGRTQTVHAFGLIPHGKTPVTLKKSKSKTSSKKEMPKAHLKSIILSRAIGCLLDFPGYGFAKAPDSKVDKWQMETQNTLLACRDQGTLVKLLLLVDARRGPMQFDRNIMGWLDDADIPYTVVLTKTDCVQRPWIIKSANEICMRYHSQAYLSNGGSQGPIVHMTSASKHSGIHELMESIDADFVGYHVANSSSEDQDNDGLDIDSLPDEDGGEG